MAKKHDWHTFYRSERFWTITFTILFLATALFATVHYRLATKDLVIADNWAASSIQQQVINQVASQIRQQYPTLPDAQVQAEAQKRWEEYQETESEAIEQQTKFLADQFRTFFQYEAGKTEKYNQTYVLEMDPYLWWHQAENLATFGSVCDPGSAQVNDITCTDAKRNAPHGSPETPFFHTQFEAFMIKVVRMFNDNVETLSIIFYAPVILALLSILPAFFIGRKLAGNIGGFVAAMIVATHPLFMHRTIAGFSDTDAYTFLFPLFIMWLIFEAVDAKHWWSRLTFAALAGVFVGLFFIAWTGWWFFFFILVVAFIAYVLYQAAHIVLEHKWKSASAYKQLIVPASLLATFLVVAHITGAVVGNMESFLIWFKAPFSYSANLQAATATQISGVLGWPNILTTVAELNVPSLGTIISNLGGRWLVSFAIAGLFMTLIDPRKLSWQSITYLIAIFIYYFVLASKGLGLGSVTFMLLFALPVVLTFIYFFLRRLQVNIVYTLFLMAWLVATVYASTRGIRFIMLGIPPFAIGFGVAMGWLFIAISDAVTRETKKPLFVQAIVGALILLLVFNPAASYSPLTQAKQASSQQLPGMNDAWWDAMKVINEQTPPNTIITSWWDFGHWFRNIGNRSVTFDGGSQNPEPGHWIGKSLLAANETESIGILRMFDCGRNDGYRTANKYMSVVEAKDLINEIIVMNRAAAQRRLAQTDIPADEQAAILDNTHCSPPPAVYITSGDMVGKAGVWGHFGSWDFRKAMAYEYSTTLPQAEAIQKIQEMGYDSAAATETYYTIRAFSSPSEANGWIAPWPTFITQDWRGCIEQNGTVTCPLYVGIAQTQQGTIAIDTASFNRTNPNQVTLVYGVYNNGARLGGAATQPLKVVVADLVTKKMTTTNTDAKEFNVGLLIRKQGTAQQSEFSVILADPLQVESTFAQLYFLDGAFSKHFTKFVEREELGGSKIIVWNVTWPQ